MCPTNTSGSLGTDTKIAYRFRKAHYWVTNTKSRGAFRHWKVTSWQSVHSMSLFLSFGYGLDSTHTFKTFYTTSPPSFKVHFLTDHMISHNTYNSHDLCLFPFFMFPFQIYGQEKSTSNYDLLTDFGEYMHHTLVLQFYTFLSFSIH